MTRERSRTRTGENHRMDTLTGQLEALRRGDVTSKELTEQSLAAIETTQETLNAFRVVAANDARRAAEEADEQRARGEDKPLLGVPLCIKDDTDLAGHPTAFGCPGDFPPATTDAELVRRLKDAGAVIVGKTHSSELGQWPLTGMAHTGYTRNPWAQDRSPGGSSGGTAAAVSAGLVPAGLGSDGAGSIRIPAAWTNLVGIKPQRGRLSTYPWREAFYGLTVNGPLARTVKDAALLLDVLQGNHDDEVHRPERADLVDAADREPPRLRVGLSTKPPFTGIPSTLDPQIRRAVEDIGGTLVKHRHYVEHREPGYGPAMALDLLARSTVGLDDWRRHLPDGTPYDKRTTGNANVGKAARRVLTAARKGEERSARRVLRQFEHVDVFVAPTSATPPLPVEAIDGISGWRTDQVIVQACPYTWPWNVLGWPAVNVPAGFTEDGLPIGVQLMGPPDSEELLVSLAAQLEAARAWHQHTPGRWW
ncbi:MAG: amidase [Nocardioides sp.]